MTVKCGVGVVLMTLENTFLIGKRLESGLYGLPGGSIEFGEQVVRTAQRELYEETRLRVPLEQFTPFKVLNCIKEDYHTVSFLVIAPAPLGQVPLNPEPGAPEPWIWVTWEAMASFPLFYPLEYLTRLIPPLTSASLTLPSIL